MAESEKGFAERIAAVEARLEELHRRLDLVEAARVTPVAWRPIVAGTPEVASAAPAVAGGEGEGRWSGSSVLARVSTISFLLVIALGLRTFADSGMIGPGTGTTAGLAYASALMLAGWVQYARRSLHGPVFAICGALLLCSIVVETHVRFGSLGHVPAHLILGAAALFMAVLGERFRTPVPGVVGVLGVLFSAVALNVPGPDFVPFVLLLLAASVIGVPVTRRIRGDGLGWTAFLLSATVLFIWAVRIRVGLTGCPDPSALVQSSTWFPPLVWIFPVFWLCQALYGLLWAPRPLASLLSFSLPTLGPAVAYLAGLQVAATRGNARAHGVVGFLFAALLVGLAAWVGRRRSGPGLAAVPAFGLAAVVLFSLGFSSATGSLLGALPFLSLTAYGFAVLSVRWASGGTRLISYLLQIFVACALAYTLVAGGATEGSPLLAVVASLALAVTALAHHRWCRRHAPPAGSLAFRFLGSGDRCAVALLTAALAGGFFLLRTAVAVALGGPAEDVRGAYLGAQSLIISLSGIVIFALAARSRSRELRSVAILLTLVGAAKVFLFDLIAISGVPRLVSVFSFGLLAAVASLVLGRWQRGGAA